MSNIEHENEEVVQAAERIAGILIGKPKRRKSFDSYAHPDTKDRAEKGLLAVKPVEEATIRKSRIVQTPTDKESLSVQSTETTTEESSSVQIELPPMPVPLKTCTQCGTLFSPYKHGCMEPNKCKLCVKSNIAGGMKIKNLRKRFEADADQYAKDHPENLSFNDAPPILTLTFAQKRDIRVYEAICASAENDRRTPENQVLHFLEMALNGFASDVVFALEEPITREG